MKTKKFKQAGKHLAPIPAVGTGLGISITLSLILSAVLAWLVSAERLPYGTMDGATILIQAISAFAGSMVAMILAGRIQALMAAACIGSYFAVLLCMNILELNSNFGGIGKGIVGILVGGIAAVLTVLFMNREKGHKRARIR